jgi:hypothetical protein
MYAALEGNQLPTSTPLAPATHRLDSLVGRLAGIAHDLQRLEERTQGTQEPQASGGGPNAPISAPPVEESIIHGHNLVDVIEGRVRRLLDYVG